MTIDAHALVVGGTRGIGLAVVRRLAAAGARVSVAARTDPGELAAPGARFWRLDMEDTASLAGRVRELAAAHGPIGNVVLLQRYRGSGDDWHGELGVSATGTREVIEAAAELFDERGGSIVLLCSHSSQFVSHNQPVSYHVGKAAIRQLARYYAVALGPRGIRVNCVTPGHVLKENGRGLEGAAAVLAGTPLRRIATADDIAAIVAFLCGDDASLLTGQDLVVDGGTSLHQHETLMQLMSTPKREGA